MGGYSVGEGAWRDAPSVAIKCELPSPLHHIPDRQKNLIERIAKLRKEAKKDWVNLGTRGRESSGNGRALREPGAPLTKRLHIVANDGCNGDPYALAVKWWGRFIKEAQNAGCDFGDWEPPLFYRTDPDGVETEILLPRPRRLADNEDGDEGEDDPFDSGGRYTIPCGARPQTAVGTALKWAAKHRGHGVEARPPSVSLGILIGPSSASLVNADAAKLLIYSVGRRHLNTLALTKNHALAGRITSGASNITSSQSEGMRAIIADSMKLSEINHGLDSYGYIIMDADKLPDEVLHPELYPEVIAGDHLGLHSDNVARVTGRLLAHRPGSPSVLDFLIAKVSALIRKAPSVHVFIHDSSGCDDAVAVVEIAARVAQKVFSRKVDIIHLCEWYWNKKRCQREGPCDGCSENSIALKMQSRRATNALIGGSSGSLGNGTAS